MWFRRDLRLGDNPALIEACRAADAVVPLFVSDDRLRSPSGAARLGVPGRLPGRARPQPRWRASCAAPATRPRWWPTSPPRSKRPPCSAPPTSGPYGSARDTAVERALDAAGRRLCQVGSPYAVEPGTVVKRDGEPFRVFTPFSRAWRAHGWDAPHSSPRGPRWLAGVRSERSAGRTEGRRRSARAGRAGRSPSAPTRFSTGRWPTTPTDATTRAPTPPRDSRPTSSGAASIPGSCWIGSGAGKGPTTFATELAWREFYADVLFHQPEIGARGVRREDGRHAGRPRRQGRRAVRGLGRGPHRLSRSSTPGCASWLATGWMHNRVRMVTASFLVKDLHLPWQWGARHFLVHLVDGDLASNNHGWQWMAGRGTDAAPYFRVFNPVTQGRALRPGRRLHPPLGARAAATSRAAGARAMVDRRRATGPARTRGLSRPDRRPRRRATGGVEPVREALSGRPQLAGGPDGQPGGSRTMVTGWHSVASSATRTGPVSCSTTRKAAILQAVVEEYIDTAQPVGSGHVARSSQVSVSSATVRNDMATLEAGGLPRSSRTPAPGGYPPRRATGASSTPWPSPAPRRAYQPAGADRSSSKAHGELEQMLARHQPAARRPHRLRRRGRRPAARGGRIRSIQVVGLAPRVGAGRGRARQRQRSRSARSTFRLRRRRGHARPAATAHLVTHARRQPAGRGAGGARARRSPSRGGRVGSGRRGRPAHRRRSRARLRRRGVADGAGVRRRGERAHGPAPSSSSSTSSSPSCATCSTAGSRSPSAAETGIAAAGRVLDRRRRRTRSRANRWARIGVLGPTRMNYPQALAAVAVVSESPRSTLERRLRATAEMASDYYELLGVSRTPPPTRSRRAYRRLRP